MKHLNGNSIITLPYVFIAKAQGSYVHNVAYGYGMSRDKAKRMAIRSALNVSNDPYREGFKPVTVSIALNEKEGWDKLDSSY